ncbi:MAG: TonB-dependent receptor plug domain-containing protein [Betaproteobacteria bacterium]|nr:TonB-dependent receptor plug domain-containing protein [Betaproteobacteria bacterium]
MRIAANDDTQSQVSVFANMSLEELLNVRVTSGTLMGSDRRSVPAAVTTITSQDIRDSGARGLNELLEIYVPNALYLRSVYESTHFGMRGILSDRDNKYLLVVNGKVMNEATHAGAITERDLLLLGDIKEVRVVRGPGSAVYGAGAIAGVVEIETFTGKSFEGVEGTVRAGAIDEFYTAEFKIGHTFSNDVSLFFYGGVQNRRGARWEDQPLISAQRGWTWEGAPDDTTGVPANGHFVTAGDKIIYRDLQRDGRDYRSLAPLKLHLELTAGELSWWARYTRGGEELGYPLLGNITSGFPWETGIVNDTDWWAVLPGSRGRITP